MTEGCRTDLCSRLGDYQDGLCRDCHEAQVCRQTRERCALPASAPSMEYASQSEQIRMKKAMAQMRKTGERPRQKRRGPLW